MPPNQPAQATTFDPHYRRPSVRLSLKRNANPQVYGHLSRTHRSQGPGHLQLDDPPSAYLVYILGSDWRSRVITPVNKSSKARANASGQVPGYGYIPVPDNNDKDEHCLRMKRCGALLVTPGGDYSLEPQDRSIQAAERQIFGWPSAGGVWIYRIPAGGLRLDRECFGEWLAASLRDLEQAEPEKRALEALYLEIQHQRDMEGICEVLKTWAQYTTITSWSVQKWWN